MSEIVELNENSNYYTVLLEKIYICSWLSADFLVWWQPVVTRLKSLLTAGCHQTLPLFFAHSFFFFFFRESWIKIKLRFTVDWLIDVYLVKINTYMQT